MDIVSRLLNRRNIPTTLCINGDDSDDLWRGPLGYDVATAVYLRAMHDKVFIDTMTAEDYKAFVAGNDVELMVTAREDDDILCVMVQLGNGACICGDELTDADFRKKETVLTVGCVKKGKNYNFLIDNVGLQPVVHKYLLELWEKVYGLKKSDPDFVDKLLELHYQYNPDEERPQKTQQPTQQPQKTATPASAGVQTSSNGTTTIGDFYSYNSLKLKAALEQNKSDTGITDANDAIMGAMARNLMQATGIYLGVYGKENSEPARQRKAVELVGFKEEQIDALFGKKAKDDSGKDGSKDGKKDADGKAEDELAKTEKYDYEVGFGDEPKLTDGTSVDLSRVQGALEAVKATTLAEGNSLARMYKLVRAWDLLERVVKEATDAKLSTVGMTCLHYRLSEADVFMLKIQGKKGLMPLCFGNEKKPQQSN